MADQSAAPVTPVANASAPAPVSKDTNPQPVSKDTKSATPVVKVDENGVAAETPKKIWKLKVNGKEVDYDATDEAKLQRDLQKVIGIEEKAKTAAEKADQAEKLMTLLTSDYKGFVKQ